MARAITKHDRELAFKARWKLNQEPPKTPTRLESQALQRVERADNFELCCKVPGAVPKGVYTKMTGVARGTLKDQATRWGFPFEGDTLDLWAVLKGFHEFMGKHGQRIGMHLKARGPDADIMDSSVTSPWLEKVREQRFISERRKNELAEGRLLNKKDVGAQMRVIATTFWKGARKFEQKHGKRAADDLDKLINKVIAACEKVAGETDEEE